MIDIYDMSISTLCILSLFDHDVPVASIWNFIQFGYLFFIPSLTLMNSWILYEWVTDAQMPINNILTFNWTLADLLSWPKSIWTPTILVNWFSLIK